ncbi:MAG: AAA family ATPase [Dehalococcoidia bacterium]|nr:AAA family ATPase [Dehalococcoidia bacterium]
MVDGASETPPQQAKRILTGQAGIYAMALPEYDALLRVDHMREGGGNLFCWLWVEHHQRPLFMEKINLVAGTAKKNIAAKLERMIGLQNPSAEVEDFAQGIIRDYEKGEPLVQVSELGEPPPVEYIVRPWIVAGACSLWYGHGGAGKTTILDWLGTLAMTREGEQGINIDGPCNVGVLDYEGNQDMAQRNLNALYRSYFPEGLSPVYYRRGGRSLMADSEELRHLGMEKDIGWWIVDSALGALQDDSNSGDPVTRCFTVARSLCRQNGSPAAVSFIGHEQKPGKDDDKMTKTPLGSGQWWNQARDVFHVVGSQEPDKSVQVGVYHQKSNIRRQLRPQSYRIQYQSDTNDALQQIVVTRSDITMTPDLADKLPMWRRIEGALRRGAKSLEVLYEELKCVDEKAKANLRALLHKYKGRFWMQHTDDTWGILEKESNVIRNRLQV